MLRQAKSTMIVLGTLLLSIPFTMVPSAANGATGKDATAARKKSTSLQLSLTQADRRAIIRDANDAINRYLKRPVTTEGKEGQKGIIPRELWGDAITKLMPVRVYDDRVNVAIVLKEDAQQEEGLYVSIPISSYAPGYDKRLSQFVKLSQPEDRDFGTLYRYQLKKTAP